MERTTYMQKKRKGGFTLAEFLVVIAITTILAGVSFVTAIHYQSRLRRLEMDQTAKEIFLAAQNRLSLEKAGGSLERLLAEYPDPEDPDSEDKLGLTLSSGSEEKQGFCISREMRETMTQKISDSVCFPLVPLMKPSVQMEVMRLVITRKREP